MRVLFITPYIPSLVRVRPYNLLRALVQRGHEVTLVTLQPPGDAGETLPHLREICSAVHVISHPRLQTFTNSLAALPTDYPVQAAYSRSATFKDLLQHLMQCQAFDVAHVEHLRGAVLAEALGNLPVIFDSVDSISLLFQKVLKDAPSFKSRMMALLDLKRTQRFEAQLTSRFSHVTVTSEIDRQALIELGNHPDHITVISNGVDMDYFQPQDVERKDKSLVFSGKMSYHANIAAVEDLGEKIMPLVWEAEPEANLQIVGKDPAPVILELGAQHNITVTGYVPDLRPYLAQAAIAVSTVRYGVGIQNKVLEAMAMATPVVCSPQASSALKAINGRDLLIGENPQAIAQHIVDLLRSPDEQQKIGQAGRAYVERYHTWDSGAATLEDLYENAIKNVVMPR